TKQDHPFAHDTMRLSTLVELGGLLDDQGNFTEATNYMFDAVQFTNQLLIKTKNEHERDVVLKHKSAIYSLLGMLDWAQGNYTDALKKHDTAFHIREHLADTFGMAKSYNNMGLVYMEQGN